MNRALQIIVAAIFFACTMMTIAQADWRKDIGIFRVGIVTKQDTATTVAHYEPFKKALSKALEMDVEIFPARNEARIIQALTTGRIEYAVLSTSGYALSWVLCECVEPLVTARTIDRGDGYHTVVITPVTGISDKEKLESASIGVLAKQSISGHPFAKFLLSKESVRVDAPQKQFITYESGHETLEAFQNGEIDALIGWSSMTGDPTRGFSSGTLRHLGNSNDNNANPYRIIWNSPALPYRPHAVAKKLDREAKLILRITMEALYDKSPVAYDVVEPKYGGGFIASQHSRFEPLIEFVQSLYEPKPERILPSTETVGSVKP